MFVIKSNYRIFTFIFVISHLLLLNIGCGDVEYYFKKLKKNEKKQDLEIARLKEEVSKLNNTINRIKHEIKSNGEESYLKVISETLNIRYKPVIRDDTLIAVAEQGAFLRKIKNCINNNWCKVEFMICGFSYQGYCSSKKMYVKEEYYDPFTFSRLYRRGLIKYKWLEEVHRCMKRKKYKSLGIGLKIYSQGNQDQFFGYLVRSFYKYNIELKSFPYISINELKKVERLCATNRIDAFLNINIKSKNSKSKNNKVINTVEYNISTESIEILLIDNSAKIMNSFRLPVHSVLLND